MNCFRSSMFIILFACAFAACHKDDNANKNPILFIEQHSITNGVLISGPEPPLLMIDFPTYTYHKNQNLLEGLIEFELSRDLKVIYGSGGCLTGTAGGGCGTGLKGKYEIPFLQGNFELFAIDSNGKISCKYKGEPIELIPGEEWISNAIKYDTTEVEGELSISEITTTDKLVNWGFLERDSIISWEW